MPLPENNEQLQELSILVQDRISRVGRYWWYALGASIVLCIPLFFVARSLFVEALIRTHHFPAFIYQEEIKVPLEIVDKKVFKLGAETFAGFIKIKNGPNLNWGVASQPYTAVFRTLGGTEVAKFSGTTYILPGSEKVIVFPRFTSQNVPATIEVVLAQTNFVHKPTRPDPTLVVSRVEMQTSGNLIVTAALTNNTPFTIKRVDLPVMVYDRNNNVIAVNYTNVNDVKQQETRTFQFTWPNAVPGASRVEILPQANIFDLNLYELPPGQSPF